MRTFSACTAAFVTLPLIAQGWTDRSALGGPPPRYNHAMCYDASHGYVVLFGGVGLSGITLNDTWIWDGLTWSQRATPSSPAPGPCGMAYHASAPEVLLATAGQAFAWDGANWVSRGSYGFSGSRMAYDPVRHETIVVEDASANPVAVWNGLSWTTRQPLVSPSFTSSYEKDIAFDPIVGKLVLTGFSTNQQPTYWEWTGISWNQRLPAFTTSSPYTPLFGAMATDTTHGRIIMVDNNIYWGPPQPNHTWTIANGVLTRLTTPLEPSLRERAAMAFDTARGVAVLFGGTNNGGQTSMGDTWEFALGDGPSYSTFGGGCLGSTGHPAISAQGTSLPRIGQTFSLQVNNLPFTGLVFLWLGLSDQSYLGHALPFDLSVIGAPNCNVLCSGDQLVILPNVLGTSVWNFTVPPFPGAVFFNQVFALDPGVNALGLTTSNGGRGVIGM